MDISVGYKFSFFLFVEKRLHSPFSRPGALRPSSVGRALIGGDLGLTWGETSLFLCPVCQPINTQINNTAVFKVTFNVNIYPPI